MRVGGVEPRPDLVRALVDQDRELPLRSARLYDDALPDQPAYCAGAVDLGITAVQIVRGELDGKVPAPGTTVVRSLSDIAAML